MILTTPINGTCTKFPFINKTLWEYTRGVLYVHKCSKVIVRVIENRFCKERVPVRLSSENISEGLRYMDPISKLFYGFIKTTNCDPLYQNALELQKESRITYDR